MPRMSTALERRGRAVVDALDDPASVATPTTDLAAELLGHALDADLGLCYTLAVGPDGVVTPDAIGSSGSVEPEKVRGILGRLVAEPGNLYYRPLRPQPAQRNRVLVTEELLRAARRDRATGLPPVYREVLGGGVEQVRVLICNGPTQVAWVGALRLQPFGWSERALLAHAVPALHRRLVMERRMEVEALGLAAVEATLSVVAAPAVFVAGRPGALRLLLANGLGAALYDDRRDQVLPEIDAALRNPDAPSSWTVTAIAGTPPGARVFLAVRRVDADDPAPMLPAIRARLGLTPRQTEVLDRVVRGEANKEVAAWLGCSEAAVEVHVTALLRRTGLSSRVELVARFWTGRL